MAEILHHLLSMKPIRKMIFSISTGEGYLPSTLGTWDLFLSGYVACGSQNLLVDCVSRNLHKCHVSHKKNLGWSGYIYIGDYTTQLYRDYNKPL